MRILRQSFQGSVFAAKSHSCRSLKDRISLPEVQIRRQDHTALPTAFPVRLASIQVTKNIIFLCLMGQTFLRRVHKGEVELPFQCGYCDHRSDKRNNITMHCAAKHKGLLPEMVEQIHGRRQEGAKGGSRPLSDIHYLSRPSTASTPLMYKLAYGNEF